MTTVCALPLLFLALKKCAKVISHPLSLIFTLLLKEMHYCIVFIKQNLIFKESNGVSKGKTAREAELQNESIFYHPPIAVRDPPPYMENNSIKWAASS